MFRFFRTTRKSLIESDAMKKYLLYAIGEVLLVVLGILIALQINNWNETRKDKAAELVALIDLKEEFETNHHTLVDLLVGKKEKTQLWKEYLEIISNKKLSIAERGIQRPVAGARFFDSSNSTLNSILGSGKIDKIGNDTLKYLLSNWADKTKTFNRTATLHQDFFQHQLRPFENQSVPLAIYRNSGIVNPFLSKKELNEINGNIVQDLTYQNLLLSNYNWLILETQTGETLTKEFQKIIQLLSEEIKSKQ